MLLLDVKTIIYLLFIFLTKIVIYICYLFFIQRQLFFIYLNSLIIFKEQINILLFYLNFENIKKIYSFNLL